VCPTDPVMVALPRGLGLDHEGHRWRWLSSRRPHRVA
jgi:hypothetical protein